MSLGELLGNILNKHGDTIQSAALLAYLKQGEEGKKCLEVRLCDRILFNPFSYHPIFFFYQELFVEKINKGINDNFYLRNNFLSYFRMNVLVIPAYLRDWLLAVGWSVWS